jgi:hypothetical protein
MLEMRRESIEQFWRRIKQEGRLAQAQAAEADLVLQGLTRRHVQVELVAQFQPTDGTVTRAWSTPNSWACGRRFAKKAPPSAAEQYEENLRWVYEHLGQVQPKDAPDPQKRSLLLFAEQKPGEFHRKYQRALPGITRRQEAQEEERRRNWEQREWQRLQAERAEHDRKKRQAERKRQWRLRQRQRREAEDRAEQARLEQERWKQAEKEQQERERQQRREATLAVLRDGRTIESTRCGEPARDTNSHVEVEARYQHKQPALPNDAEPEVTGSVEAKAWQAKLDAGNARRREGAEQQARDALTIRVVERKEQERRKRMAQLTKQADRLRGELNAKSSMGMVNGEPRFQWYTRLVNQLRDTEAALLALLTPGERGRQRYGDVRFPEE